MHSRTSSIVHGILQAIPVQQGTPPRFTPISRSRSSHTLLIPPGGNHMMDGLCCRALHFVTLAAGGEHTMYAEELDVRTGDKGSENPATRPGVPPNTSADECGCGHR